METNRSTATPGVAAIRPNLAERRPTVLLALLLFVGLLAVPCGVLLMVNGLWMPTRVLDHSPFASFLIPGLMLSVVVGGSLLIAAWLIWSKHALAALASLVAGGILLGWIVVESMLVSEGRPPQAAILLCALAIFGTAWRIRQRFPA